MEEKSGPREGESLPVGGAQGQQERARAPWQALRGVAGAPHLQGHALRDLRSTPTIKLSFNMPIIYILTHLCGECLIMRILQRRQAATSS